MTDGTARQVTYELTWEKGNWLRELGLWVRFGLSVVLDTPGGADYAGGDWVVWAVRDGDRRPVFKSPDRYAAETRLKKLARDTA